MPSPFSLQPRPSYKQITFARFYPIGNLPEAFQANLFCFSLQGGFCKPFFQPENALNMAEDSPTPGSAPLLLWEAKMKLSPAFCCSFEGLRQTAGSSQGWPWQPEAVGQKALSLALQRSSPPLRPEAYELEFILL